MKGAWLGMREGLEKRPERKGDSCPIGKVPTMTALEGGKSRTLGGKERRVVGMKGLG